MLLHIHCQAVEVIIVIGRALRRRAVLEPADAGDEVGAGAGDVEDAEALLALADEEEAVVGEALVLDDLADAADGGEGAGVGEDDAEAEVGGEEGVHQDAVAELEDLEGEDGVGEEDEGEGEEGEVDCVVDGGRGRGGGGGERRRGMGRMWFGGFEGREGGGIAAAAEGMGREEGLEGREREDHFFGGLGFELWLLW